MTSLLVKLLSSAALAAMLLLSATGGQPDAVGAVYTMTNESAGNSVVVFKRLADGSLVEAGAVPTGGLGSGGGLGNQGALVLSDSERWLFAVNAGSGELSVFAVTQDGLELADKQPSGGIQPISVTVHQDLVYVLNEGGAGNISGFRIDEKGKLSPIPGSTQFLNGPGTDPAQVAFHPSGDVLMVTVKDTNEILTYTVGRDGVAGGPKVHASAGTTPFGFAFGKRGQVFVSEAAGGAPNASSTSSYELSSDDGQLRLITPAVAANGTAACWLVVTKDGHFAYTSNTASDSLSTYRIEFDGSITLARTTGTGPGTRPLDSALTNNSRYFYVLNAGNGTLSGFRVEADGALSTIPVHVNPLPPSANGLAAR